MEVRARRLQEGLELTCRICRERLALAESAAMYDPMNGFLAQHRHCQPRSRQQGRRPARSRMDVPSEQGGRGPATPSAH